MVLKVIVTSLDSSRLGGRLRETKNLYTDGSYNYSTKDKSIRINLNVQVPTVCLHDDIYKVQ